jgi:hypothetical protein
MGIGKSMTVGTKYGFSIEIVYNKTGAVNAPFE